MYNVIRSLLFALPPEVAHTISLNCLKYTPKICFPSPIIHNPIKLMGLEFKHPIGLAAGLDKNGEYLDALDKLGFSFIEIGTVTPKPQAGNPKPRLFRLPQQMAIINRMGFNNHGVHAMVKNLKKTQYSGILGINIGKNKDTALNNAKDDYVYCLQQVYPYANYITINISSPNTPDLRQLQQENYLLDLMHALKLARELLIEKHQRYVPLLIKISPDESNENLKRITDNILAIKLDGIIATNTTCARTNVRDLLHAEEAGGLSGKPLLERANDCVKIIREIVGGDFPLIGVGGITDAASARSKLDAGANLLQVYSGLIYNGPSFVTNILLKHKKF